MKRSAEALVTTGNEEISGEDIDDLRCKPFVKWAGGKMQIVPELIKRVPRDYFRYLEPFAGGAALYFKLQPRRAYLADINLDLINTYRVIKSNVEGLIRDLSTYVYSKDYFYWIRDIERQPEYRDWSPIQRASRFIYLNKTCFNGLYRVNSQGFFNTPFGRYKNPTICDAYNLRACSRLLQNTEVVMTSFIAVEEEARAGDFVYFDPPYHPRSGTACFTEYAAGGFGAVGQAELKALCERLNRKGVKFMVSNSDTDLIWDLYRAFNIERVAALRAINSKAERRGHINELVIRNYE